MMIQTCLIGAFSVTTVFLVSGSSPCAAEEETAPAITTQLTSNLNADPDRQQLFRDLKQSFRFWFQQLSADDPQKVKRAAYVLEEAARIVHTDDLDYISRNTDVVSTPAEEQRERRRLATQYRRDFRDAVDDMIEFLAADNSPAGLWGTESPAADAIACCLAACSPDGSVLLEAKRRLPSGRVCDELLVKLFQYTVYTLPPDEPLSEILIPELRKLSEASRLSLGAKWHDEIQPDGDAKPVWLCSPALVAMGFCQLCSNKTDFRMKCHC